MVGVVEYGYTSLNKFGEELCGDKVETCVADGWTTLVLADGLGSGVKANILSTLTSKILCTMVANNIPMQDCMETIIDSLPICKVRGVAYSTFSLVHVNEKGEGYLIEFDNPQAIYIRDGKTCDLIKCQMDICGKRVYHSRLTMQEGDSLVVTSDGTIHAGVGMILNFGWQREDIKKYLDQNLKTGMSARSIAWLLASACNDLYVDKPGDDTTVAVVKFRGKDRVNVMVGPSTNKEDDQEYVERFFEPGVKKIVCGGTTSQIVSRVIGKPLTTSFDFPDPEVPPIGYIEGIDLTTEGVITLRRVLELSEKYVSPNDLTPKTFVRRDGASMLAQILFEEATDIHFFVGQGMNAAHKGLPIDLTMKLKLIESLSSNLRRMGKNVEVTYN